jgi:hypothetical protein
VPRHGILTNTSSSNVTIHGSFIETVGSGCNLDHGVYFRPLGRISRNVFKDIRCGYGIHLYAPHDTIVAENTSVGSRVRAGIIIETDGSNITVVNNIFANNATADQLQSCGRPGIDNNITWGTPTADRRQPRRTGDKQPQRSRLHRPRLPRQQLEPRQDTARAPFSYFADLDGVTHDRRKPRPRRI